MIKFQPSDHLGDENSLYWEKQAKGPRVLSQGSLSCSFMSVLWRRGKGSWRHLGFHFAVVGIVAVPF